MYSDLCMRNTFKVAPLLLHGIPCALNSVLLSSAIHGSTLSMARFTNLD